MLSGTMLERTDRIGLVVADADAAAETYRRIFDTRVVGDHREDARCGRAEMELARDPIQALSLHGRANIAAEGGV